MKNTLIFSFVALLFATAYVQVSFAEAVAGGRARELYTQDKLDNAPAQLVSSETPENNTGTQQTPSDLAQMFNDFPVNDDEMEEQLVACTEGSITGSSQVKFQMVKREPVQADDDYSSPRDHSRRNSPYITTAGGGGNGGTGGSSNNRPFTNPVDKPTTDGNTNPTDDPTDKGGDTKKNEDGDTPVTPEPGTMILMGFGLAGLAPFAYRRRYKNV